MTETTKRGIKEGIGFGLIASLIFGLAQIIAAMGTGLGAAGALRMPASIIVGDEVLTTAWSLTNAALLGVTVHVVLSAVFGTIYGMANAKFSVETETDYGRQTGLGLAFGALLWLVNLQIIARAGYPWFLETNQWVQVLLHAVFFGLPLALMYALAERRAHHIGTHATARA